ncbi:hypothetical protein L2E82_49003 [Cichorium intybus]|uniref:Uncharacterized protein n=1 Tax=Cichorium intybus TaxID=13427 RepID=A0ACB8Z0H5_CICIN|nr:hypothetical protein L2E82_49003 [Cichorium intybus]
MINNLCTDKRGKALPLRGYLGSVAFNNITRLTFGKRFVNLEGGMDPFLQCSFQVVPPLKLFNAPFQPSNLLSLILFFAFGLCFGILLTFQLKNVSFNLLFNDFPLSATTAALPPPPTPIRLDDFIHPSKIMHRMTDQEGPVLLSPLWERFFKGHDGLFNIYVHSSDSSSNQTEPSTQFSMAEGSLAS